MGTSEPFMRRVVARWLQGYDWRAWEARLNAFEQYRIMVDGLGIHCLVERGSSPSPMPIILTHGWPGSPVELLGMVELLAHPERFGGSVDEAFTVVVPSLPGCGFSDAPPGPISPRDVGRLWAEMMSNIFGFGRYMAHGGDWGAVITSWMAVDRPRGLVGAHLNAAVVTAPWTFANVLPSPEETAHLERLATLPDEEKAYQLVHGYRPQSLAFAVHDSPVGLAAWILEKFHNWTVGKQDIDPPFDLDDLITNVMFYWLGDPQAVSWMYRYLVDWSGFTLGEGEFASVPCGFCLFPDDTAPAPPEAFVRRAYNVAHYRLEPHGGHFPGLEHPHELVEDIRRLRAELGLG
ncbi:Soluble epoxide hydrolase [Mycolicibacterium vanbaalenii]|uniref:Soluble epoxide hydrolase n=2 Tax=Mycolicibacterium vanbaalenii TaxID=110539 RepID=A0A5S9R9C2_MYCVN|nr:Soluble epoxide hydrolase [Mycolicibacterium vanbaalenii]